MAHEKEHASNATSQEGGGMNMGVAVIGFILCFLAGGGLMWSYDQHRLKSGDITADTASGASKAGVWSDEDSPIPVSSKDPLWGKREAPVSIVVFSDFQCPYCSKVEATLDQVKSKYGPEKVRILWKNQPLSFHKDAKPAAEAAQATFATAGSEAFWKFHATAFKNQAALTADNFEKWAKEAGVKDMAKWKAAKASAGEKVEKDMAVAKQVGVSGTPASYINGVMVSGAQPFEAFQKVIEAELGKAQAKSGVAKDRLYVELSKENKKNAPAPKDEEEEDGPGGDKVVWKVPVGTSPVLGKADALVTMMIFSDFECPYCSKVEPTLNDLRTKYGDKIRMVWKNEPLPFHKKAEPAAEVALEARAQKGDKGFWEAHDKLFENQKNFEKFFGEEKNRDDAEFTKFLGELGLNADKVKDAIKTKKHNKLIAADMEVAEDFQANGTPHFFINGRRLSGAQPKEKFEKLIDEEVKKAQDLMAKGTPAAKLYEELTKDGKGPPEPEKKAVPASIPSNDPFKGPANAKVVIHEWSDFQCPYCARVEDTIKEVTKNYGDKVKFVWHDLPLPMHPDAPLASQGAREALKQKGPDMFWKMHDKLFEKQKELKREHLDSYAKELGLDMDKWKAALDNTVHKAAVEAAAKSGGDAGISGTPAFLIVAGGSKDGYFINGAQPYTKFRKLIERALSEAK